MRSARDHADPHSRAPRVMATLRNIAISTIRLTGANSSAKTLRHNRYNFHATLSLLGISTTNPSPPRAAHNLDPHWTDM